MSKRFSERFEESYPELNCKFKLDQLVQHKDSGSVYRITCLPEDFRLLEYCGEPYYEYTNDFGTFWVRAKTEMEDGRFIPATNLSED